MLFNELIAKCIVAADQLLNTVLWGSLRLRKSGEPPGTLQALHTQGAQNWLKLRCSLVSDNYKKHHKPGENSKFKHSFETVPFFSPITSLGSLAFFPFFPLGKYFSNPVRKGKKFNIFKLKFTKFCVRMFFVFKAANSSWKRKSYKYSVACAGVNYSLDGTVTTLRNPRNFAGLPRSLLTMVPHLKATQCHGFDHMRGRRWGGYEPIETTPLHLPHWGGKSESV